MLFRSKCDVANIMFGWVHDRHVNEITQTDKQITMKYGYMDFVRTIHMDQKQHPKNIKPSRGGHSIGSWDGDTLVVDTVGFNDKSWFDFRGHPHTDKLHTVERYTRKDFNTLVREILIDDPGAYSKPFTVTFTAKLMPKGELMEYICQENNKDVPHIIGPAGPGGGQVEPRAQR